MERQQDLFQATAIPQGSIAQRNQEGIHALEGARCALLVCHEEDKLPLARNHLPRSTRFVPLKVNFSCHHLFTQWGSFPARPEQQNEMLLSSEGGAAQEPPWPDKRAPISYLARHVLGRMHTDVGVRLDRW